MTLSACLTPPHAFPLLSTTEDGPPPATSAELLHLRAWSTDIQDDESLAGEVRGLGRTLAHMLAMRGRAETPSLRRLVDDIIAGLLEQLAGAGLRP